MSFRTHLYRASTAWLLTLLVLVAGPALAQTSHSPLELPAEGTVAEVKTHALTRPDPDRSLDPEQLMASDEGFLPFDPALNREAPPTWLKFQVAAPADSSGRYVLRVARRFFEQFELYTPLADGTLELRTADSYSAIDAKRVGIYYVLNLEVPPGESAIFLLFVETVQASLQPLELWIQDESSFATTQSHTYLVFGLIFGILLALIFYNFVLYLNLRLRGHLYYVLAMSSMLLLLGVDSGLLQNYLLPEALMPYVTRLNVLFAALMVITISLFYQVFVHSARHTPRMTRVIQAGIVVLAAIAISQLFAPLSLLLLLTISIQLINVAIFVLLLVGAFIAGRNGSAEGWIFLAAWSVFLVSAFSRTLLTLDVAGRNVVFEYLMYFGAVVEASILALGLAYRVRQLYERHANALREQHKAARLANLDPLTNAYNRRFLQHFLGNALPGGDADSFGRAVLILDLDNFKEANDEYGHAAGDLILRQLVERCQRVMRESDVLCRLGGDEFVIVLSDQGERTGQEVAERIVEEIGSEPFVYEGQSIRVTTSVGVVSTISPRSSSSDILRMADQALYQAKQAGRNRATLFDPDQETPFRHGASLTAPEQENT